MVQKCAVHPESAIRLLLLIWVGGLTVLILCVGVIDGILFDDNTGSILLLLSIVLSVSFPRRQLRLHSPGMPVVVLVVVLLVAVDGC
jgi:hypothetical protein